MKFDRVAVCLMILGALVTSSVSWAEDGGAPSAESESGSVPATQGEPGQMSVDPSELAPPNKDAGGPSLAPQGPITAHPSESAIPIIPSPVANPGLTSPSSLCVVCNNSALGMPTPNLPAAPVSPFPPPALPSVPVNQPPPTFGSTPNVSPAYGFYVLGQMMINIDKNHFRGFPSRKSQDSKHNSVMPLPSSALATSEEISEFAANGDGFVLSPFMENDALAREFQSQGAPSEFELQLFEFSYYTKAEEDYYVQLIEYGTRVNDQMIAAALPATVAPDQGEVEIRSTEIPSPMSPSERVNASESAIGAEIEKDRRQLDALESTAPQETELKDIARENLSVASGSAADGNAEKAMWNEQTARAILDFLSGHSKASSFIKDLYESKTGKSLAMGSPLIASDRSSGSENVSSVPFSMGSLAPPRAGFEISSAAPRGPPPISPNGKPIAAMTESVKSPAIVCGSIINVDRGSVGEEIPLAGTPIRLFYFSDRLLNRGVIETQNSNAIAAGGTFTSSFLGTGGWSVNLVHFFSVAEGRVDLGNGGAIEVANAELQSGQYHLPSPDGSLVFVFDQNGLHRQTLHGLTGALLYAFDYDFEGRLSVIGDAYGNRTIITRSKSQILVRGPYGQEFTLAIGSDQLLQFVQNVSGRRFAMTYAPNGKLTSFAKPDGQMSTFTYDDNGHLLKDRGAGGNFSEFSRNSSSNSTSEITMSTAEGRHVSYDIAHKSDGTYQREMKAGTGEASKIEFQADGGEHLSNGSLDIQTKAVSDVRFGSVVKKLSHATVKMADFDPQEVSVIQTVTGKRNPFDFDGLQSWISVNGAITSLNYEQARRQFVIRSPGGRFTSLTIDPQGKPLRLERPGRPDEQYEYDGNGRLAKLSLGEKMLLFSYDGNGYISSMTDSSLRTVQFVHDENGQLTSRKGPDGLMEQFEYDQNGRLTAVKKGSKFASQFKYNLFGLVDEYRPPSNGFENESTSPIHYRYNLDRQLVGLDFAGEDKVDLTYMRDDKKLIGITTNRGSYEYKYAPDGKLVSLSSPDSIHLQFKHSGVRLRVQSVEYPDGTKVEVKFGYDKKIRLSGIEVGGASISNSFDPDDLLIGAGDETLERGRETGELIASRLKNTTEIYSYEPSTKEMASVRSSFNGMGTYSEQLIRDGVGRIVGRSELYGTRLTNYSYDYDLSGRLVATKKNGVPQSIYAYDEDGNRIKSLVSGETNNAQYDAQDRLLQYGSSTFTYDPTGNLETRVHGANRWHYHYDLMGNLIFVQSSAGRLVEYRVDGLNRRAEKRVNGQIKNRYVYQSQLQLAAILNELGEVESRFIYGAKANVPDYFVKGGQTYKIISDHLGSPRVVQNAETGEIMQELEYDEFGRILFDSNPGFQPFGFAGGIFDCDTGLVHFGARDYDPEIGRFLSKDPVLPGLGGNTNPYTYVRNNPVNFTDPTGAIDPVTVSILTGVAVGGVIGGVSAGIQSHWDPSAIATGAAIGAGAGVASAIAGGYAVGAGAVALANGLIGGTANIASQLVTSGSVTDYSSVVIATGAGALGGVLGLAAGTSAFYNTAVIGNEVGVGAATVNQVITGGIVSGGSSYGMDYAGNRTCH